MQDQGARVRPPRGHRLHRQERHAGRHRRHHRHPRRRLRGGGSVDGRHSKRHFRLGVRFCEFIQEGTFVCKI